MARRAGRQSQASARLARSKPVAATECLSLHRLQQGPASDPSTQARDPSSVGLLLLAIPKRLLARAVDRNCVRRIAREHWRQWPCQAIGTGHWMLRLRALPPGYVEESRAKRRGHWHLEMKRILARAIVAAEGPTRASPPGHRQSLE